MDTERYSRPLQGEPLPLDLVNTEWNEGGQRRDLLETDAGLRQWLAEHRLPIPGELAQARGALVETRAALRGCLESGDTDEAARDALNAVLDRGVIHPELGSGGPGERLSVDEAWRAAWLAARGYLTLRRDWPAERIRACAHPDCILYFLDATRSATRRWCDMRTCGNRAKAQRYHRRRTKPHR